MKIQKTLFALGLILFTTEIFGQDLPSSYQPMFNEIVTFFTTIRTGNTITQGKTSLSVFGDNKIALLVEHKNHKKNLTFIISKDEEGNPVWIAANELTIDMVNKYEDYLTKTLKSMYDLAEKKSKE
jgi:hypothetical protein